MAHGMELYDTTGKVIYSTADITWFVVDSYTYSATGNVSNTYNLPAGTLLKAQIQMLNTPSGSVEDYSPSLVISGNTVSINLNSAGHTAPALIVVLARV